ncbi:hypothetical protein [Streptomyces sp. NPDC002952]|uniref:hypothetical protein n=1 Tax=Streptomyces sp. NPDC002952 TaxID=3364673 RepID=UPI003693EF53
MRLGTLLAAGILATALLTSCDTTDHDCESAGLLPSPAAQAAPVTQARPAPPRPRPAPAAKAPKPKLSTPKPGHNTKHKPRTHTVHHDDHDCDDD